MSRVVWNAPGERRFEAGIDRAVLYTHGGDVAPWNGLKSVTHKPSGSEITTFYLDGEKFNQISENEEFAATIEAFTYPEEFELCDGTAYLSNGLSVDGQQREMFGLTYRTRIGNDLDGVDHGYKIHLVYNAIASPSQRVYSTINTSAVPTDFSWDITTMPIRMSGQAPSAHYVVDSTRVDQFVLRQFEDIIYGTDFTEPRMPTPAELTKFFMNAKVLRIVDNRDGTWTAMGPSEIISFFTETEFQITWGSAKFIDEVTYTLSTL